jgi:hypothetical protein
MAIGAFVPLVFFIAIVGSVGLRLVALWRRTRELPELSLGLGLLIVACSVPLTAIGRVPATALTPLGRGSFAAGLAALAVGLSLMVFFNYRVFRRGSLWGRALFLFIAALVFGAVVYMSGANFQGESVDAIKRTMRPGTLTIMAALLLLFAWGTGESLRCRAALLRQLRLGLGDPLVANRFLLWAIAGLASAAFVAVLTGCVLAGMTILREPIALSAIAGAGSIMSASWYLTFFAPQRYRRFIREHAASH